MHLFAYSITLLIEPVNGKSVNDGISVGHYREKAVSLFHLSRHLAFTTHVFYLLSCCKWDIIKNKHRMQALPQKDGD